MVGTRYQATNGEDLEYCIFLFSLTIHVIIYAFSMNTYNIVYSILLHSYTLHIHFMQTPDDGPDGVVK
jgi:hypothetical protein